MITERRVRASFHEQAGYCDRLGSSFMSNLLMGLAETLSSSTLTGKRILEWPGSPEPKSDALALRLAGALHALARSGVDPDLFAFYEAPERSAEPEFMQTVMNAMAAHDKELSTWLEFAPQTNEVARASIIYAGLSVIAKRFCLPMALFEMGCSGGLNLQCAEFGYRFNKQQFGESNSILQLQPKWRGSLPPKAEIEVVARAGCDLNPLSVMEQADAAKLVAYLWPDQPARIMRVEAAIEIARADPPNLEQSDAAEWVEAMFQSDGSKSVVRVLYDTIAWNYFPQAVKDRISDHMASIGLHATNECPLAWLTFEFDEEDNGPFLKLRTWPGAGKEEILASADPHAYSVDWLCNN